MMVYKAFLVMLALAPALANGQAGDTTYTRINHKRLRGSVAASATAYTTSLILLNQLWYKDDERTSFHFFNDNKEWMQIDKVGHAFSTFYISYASSRGLSWCGVPKSKADNWGSLVGFLLLVPIEIMDGYSSTYGASTGDLIANASGSLLYWGQSKLWDSPRIYPKFSFHRTDYAPKRPELLGRDLASEILKDYNGQTYWLSFDMDKFMRFPKWLNLAVGYGAEDMVYARIESNRLNGYDPHRQFYLSLDFDLMSIHTRSGFVRSALFVLNMIKLPSPTLEVSNGAARWHFLYF